MSDYFDGEAGRLASVNISVGKGTVKSPVRSAEVGPLGIMGDAHAGDWDRQISLLGQSEVDAFSARAGRTISPGEFAENLTIDGFDLRRVSLLDRLIIGDVELEITRVGKKCHGSSCAIYREVGDCIMPRQGLFARVVSGGTLTSGAPVQWKRRIIRCVIVTLSDRASAGVYEDLSGPRVKECMINHFCDTRWNFEYESKLIPDDPKLLDELLVEAEARGVDVLLTTGGTGSGPRDFTPEVVASRLHKQIPGIMEHIRVKYGASNPHALLSRGVCGTMGSTVVFTLPGSVKAVDEYMSELLSVLDHLVGMMHGLGH